MMRTMRENTKWVFYILAISFVGWLVFDVGMGATGGNYGGSDVVLRIDGEPIRLPQYQAALQAAMEQARQRTGGNLTREDEKQAEDQMVEQLIRNVLLVHETHRLGITVTDQEVREAAQTSPPPEVYSVPDFQTNGQFDPNKWRRFMQGGANRELLLQLEQRYREQIPQAKLLQYITADLYASDAKLWRIYRDQHDSVTITFLSVGPEQIADSEVSLSDAELARYFDEHKTEFTRPASAKLSFVAVPRRPSATDTAAALARAVRLRAEAAVSQAKFQEVASRESSDTASGSQGGDLGWIKRNQPGFDPLFLAGLRGLSAGQVSQPTLSRFGYHLIRVDTAKGDSARVRHVLVPIELTGTHRDSVEALVDSLDRLAAERDTGWLLDSAARRFGLPIGKPPTLVEGDRMVLGQYVIPDVGVWAFERRLGETSPVIDGEAAYYVFRLDSLDPGGVPPLSEVRDRVQYQARIAKKATLWRERAAQIAVAIKGSPLLDAARARGLPAERVGPFTRLRPPPILQLEPKAIGVAFGLRVGERSGVVVGEHRAFLVESVGRKLADSTAWLAQRDAQRESLLQAARQSRVEAYLDGLRKRANVVDRRKEIFRPQDVTAGS
ncbi:MAG TPA: SurA N-terminal domain-containing protein [Gemmatimonadales bacterium]|jgi:parvulin-like peptidyl-prolyl isomerase